MKTTLTPEQSAVLIAKGISADKASMVRLDFNGTYAYISGEEAQTVRDCVNGQFYVEESRMFSLADILSLLPKQIGLNNLYLDYLSIDRIEVGYRGERRSFGILHLVFSEELIDALYELLLWAIDNGHINLPK